MDHVVYTDAKAGEMKLLLSGTRKIIIRGATGRKLPYGRVSKGDTLYFVNNNGEGKVKAKGVVSQVVESGRLTEPESHEIVKLHQDEMNLSASEYSRWAGKRYLVLIYVSEVVGLKPFSFDRKRFGNMDDWLPVENINTIKL